MATRSPLVSMGGIATALPAGDTVPISALPSSVLDYVLAGRWDGTVPASAVVAGAPVLRAFVLPAGLAGSMLVATVAAAASAAFVLSYVRGGTRTTIGTFTFAAGATTATISGVTVPTLAAGDLLDLTGPATADATLANLYIGILGVKQ